jgi:hypothetical protein
MSDDAGAHCFLCRSSRRPVDIPWTDRPLWLDPRCGLLLPGLGGLTSGYMLLAPIGHHPNLAAAAAAKETPRDLREFIVEVLDYLRSRMGDITYWEHGGANDTLIPNSACVDHAHLHITPGRLDLPLPPRPTAHPGIHEALGALFEGPAPYLLMGHHRGTCFTGGDVGIPQYYRREWAKLRGRPTDWDYLLTEAAHRTKDTIERFFSWMV